MTPSRSLRSVLLGLLAFNQLTHAHTWVEQLMVIAPNGTMVGQPGFPRGNVLRGTPAFGDPAMVNLIPPGGDRPVNEIRSTDLMCKSTQTSQTQTDGSPRLQAAAGAAVALRYQENGHVSLPQGQPGKPDNRGTVYVYATTKSSPDDAFLAIHRQWTPDGKGGDGRGVLISTQNYDDGQCYQVNGGPISASRQAQFSHTFAQPMGQDIWCQQDVKLPDNLPAGVVTLYWVWDWPTLPGTPGFPEGKQEIYTTCMDIDIVESTGVEPVSKAVMNFQQGQDLNYAAISSQMADIANPTAVTGQFIPFSSSAAGPATGQAASESISAALPGATTDNPDFLNVHTTSTAGAAGLETQTFSVIPIGASSPTTIPTDFPRPTDNRGGRFDNGVSGFDNIGSATNINAAIGPTGMRTVTEYFTAYETVWQTVMETQFDKRNAAPTASEVHPVYQLKARTPFGGP